jgi:predicted PurR-regulated permease PerM
VAPVTRRRVFLGASAVIAAAVMIAAHEVMLPFVLASVIAYVLTPLVARLERRKVPRGAAILLVYAVVLGTLGGTVRAIAPRVALEFRTLRAELPSLAAEARTTWVPAVTDRLRAIGLAAPASADDGSPETRPPSAFVARPRPDGSLDIDVGSGVMVTETQHGYLVEPAPGRKGEVDANRVIAEAIGRTFSYAQENTLEIVAAVRSLVARVSGMIFSFFITLMLAAYMILTREHVMDFFRSLVHPDGRTGFDALLARLDKGLGGVVRGQLVICCINGALSAVGFAFIGLKYWPVMALVAGLFSLIPIFGSIASAVPAVAIGLTQGLGTAAAVLGWIVGIHQLEANVLNPKIMGDAAKIHPVLVIFSLLVGEHFFHAVGALLAVPTMSVAQSVFLHLRDVTERADAAMHDGGAAREK